MTDENTQILLLTHHCTHTLNSVWVVVDEPRPAGLIAQHRRPVSSVPPPQLLPAALRAKSPSTNPPRMWWWPALLDIDLCGALVCPVQCRRCRRARLLRRHLYNNNRTYPLSHPSRVSSSCACPAGVQNSPAVCGRSSHGRIKKATRAQRWGGVLRSTLDWACTATTSRRRHSVLE